MVTVLAPPWSAEDISAEGRPEADRARDRPRRAPAAQGEPIPLTLSVRCPHCGSTDTELLSRFSSTACKALRRCVSCREPFDHFKEV
ncbi:phenylacetic acid degradation protein [Streptomyces clavuligerus]|nr:phenylacetic acid degradation protein [Streptomyces clavuligerus]